MELLPRVRALATLAALLPLLCTSAMRPPEPFPGVQSLVQLRASSRHKASSLIEAHGEARRQELATLAPNGASPGYIAAAEEKIEAASAQLGDTTEVANEAGAGGPTMPPWKKGMLAEQPYDTRLGSAVLWEITQEATMTPPPSQKVVDALVAAQCPMIPALSETLVIGAPKCGDAFGYWEDPQGTNVIRWQAKGKAGLSVSFALDGGDSGANGTVDFMTVENTHALYEDVFEVQTCQGMPLWKVTQYLTKVEKMGQGKSTSVTSDTSLKKAAYFVQYVISHANGTAAAQTDLMKLGADAVNITSSTLDGTADQLIAQAVRKGVWKSKGWTNCSTKKNKRSWEVTFPGAVTDVDMAATAADVRVVSAATITLMAVLDAGRLEDGVLPSQFSGTELTWFFIQVAAILFLFITIPILCIWCCHEHTCGNFMRLECLRIQFCLLPHDKQKQRPVVFPPAGGF